MIPWLAPGQPFPPVDEAFLEPNGLLAAGADLHPATLLEAYRLGIFPWYSPSEPILWWSPDPRLVIEPSNVHVSRRMARTLRQPWQLTLDHSFDQVVEACAAPRPGQAGTWITREMKQAYRRMHQLGHAHSLEVWRDGELVGGIYGIAIGRAFFGESMFRRRRDGSKVALISLCQFLAHHDFGLLDCQVESAHLLTLGAFNLPRSEFCERIAALTARDGPAGDWQAMARPIQWAPFFS
ncbi:MAG: leucyl/phenylalanyl-tRNA--protein transferase [Pseudomonadota bacterium]